MRPRSFLLPPAALLCAVCLTACGGGTQTTPTPTSPAAAGSSSMATAAAAPPLNGSDAPVISRSGGQQGGIVVLWPRVIPAAGADALRPLALSLQTRLRGLAAARFPSNRIDVRPEPERVCPRNGCAAASVGAVLVHRGRGCAVLAYVSPPGKSPATLIPWSDNVELRARTVPFRAPPESSMAVHDLVPCDHLLDALGSHEAAIDEEIHRFAAE